MSKEKLAAAKQFIQEKQYKEARIILESTDHPIANEWLAKLPKPVQPEKFKNTPTRRGITNSPAFVIGAMFVLFVTFLAGAFIGQIVANYNPPPSQLDMTRTAIHNANSTTEVLIYATQTTSARMTEFNQTSDICTCSTESITLITSTAMSKMTLDPAFPTWTPTPESQE